MLNLEVFVIYFSVPQASLKEYILIMVFTSLKKIRSAEIEVFANVSLNDSFVT